MKIITHPLLDWALMFKRRSLRSGFFFRESFNKHTEMSREVADTQICICFNDLHTNKPQHCSVEVCLETNVQEWSVIENSICLIDLKVTEHWKRFSVILQTMFLLSFFLLFSFHHIYCRNAEFPFDIGHWLLRMSTWTRNPRDAFYSHKHMFLPRTNAFFSLVIFPNQLSKTNLVAFLCIETTTARVRALLTSGTRHGRVQTAKQTSICCVVITSIPLTQFSYKKPNAHLAVVEED